MDAVISYVNGCEKTWRTEFNKQGSLVQTEYMRYYDWGTLRFVLRGISTYMPYIKNVFILVSNIEQVPDYVDKTKVKVILHKDFIPEEHLPTYNSCTIELFMHNIPGLDEEFIYFNDDMIPLSPIAYSDLISNGKLCMSFVDNYSINGKASYYIIQNSFRAACLYVADKDTYNRNIITEPLEYTGPGISHIHGPCVFLKSKNKNIYEAMKDYLEYSISKIRKNINISQYVYSDVFYLENNYIGSRLTLKYISSVDLNEDSIKDEIMSANTNYLCINDLGALCGLTYKESSDVIQQILNKRLPKISKYELCDK